MWGGYLFRRATKSSKLQKRNRSALFHAIFYFSQNKKHFDETAILMRDVGRAGIGTCAR